MTRSPSARSGERAPTPAEDRRARFGLELDGRVSPGDPPNGIRDLRLLRSAGVISGERCDRLVKLHQTWNELLHEYPDLRARRLRLHGAVRLLVDELPGFLRDYGAWLRSLGYE